MSTCPELPDELWAGIIRRFCDKHGIYAAKRLRTYARVNQVWWMYARIHPDNLIAPLPFTTPWSYHGLDE